MGTPFQAPHPWFLSSSVQSSEEMRTSGNHLQMRTPKQGGRAQIQASGDPHDLSHPGPTLRACRDPQGRRMGALWKKARCENLETTKAVSKRSAGVGEQRIKASIQAEKGAGTAEEGKKSP